MNERARALSEIKGAVGGQCNPAAGQLAYERCLRDVAVRKKEFEEKRGIMTTDIRALGRKGANEQGAMASQAMAGAMTSLITGAVQTTQAIFNLKGAKQLEEAARKLDKLANQAPPVPIFTPLAPANLQPGDALAPGGGQSLNPGTGNGQASTDDETQDGPTDFGNLGDPTGREQENNPDPGPTGGEFVAGAPPGGGGGNGGGFGGVGGASTSPSSGGDSEAPQAKMADSGSRSSYEGNGGTFGAAAGGGGVGADRGPDLSGLLAQFLPKAEDAQGNKGITNMDFGSRGLASEAPISLLDRTANIFDRIHETYQEKNRRGRVGL
jgi:hypothetical protein